MPSLESVQQVNSYKRHTMENKKIEDLPKEHYMNRALSEFNIWFKEAPLNSQKYEKRLLEAFPLERDLNCEHFYSRPTGYWDAVGVLGADGIDYIACREIFEGMNWDQINFNSLYTKYVQTLCLNADGLNYYLPAFLKYFYDLRHSNLMFFDRIIGDLAVGCVSTRYRIGEDGRSYLVPVDYSSFERLTPDQSKLIAAFLVHVANLNESTEAQNALRDYWGKFLLL